MKFIKPIAITDAMIGAATSVPEPAPGEVAWVPGASYSAGDVRIRTTTHRKYLALQAHSDRTTAPENDPAYWEDVGPTMRWAPFDHYVSTAATATGTITYVLNPGYFNALALYGLAGSAISIQIKDGPGGSVIYSFSAPLYDDPAGWYEYLFLPPTPVTKLAKDGLPIRPTAELTVTVTAAAGQPVAIGMIVVGDMVSLVGDPAEFGGTEHGSLAEPITYSYIKTDEFGNTSIVRRHKSTNMTARIVLPTAHADRALGLIRDVLDVPVPWVATARHGYSGLNVFGLGSARVTYESAGLARIDLSVKGMI